MLRDGADRVAGDALVEERFAPLRDRHRAPAQTVMSSLCTSSADISAILAGMNEAPSTVIVATRSLAISEFIHTS